MTSTQPSRPRLMFAMAAGLRDKVFDVAVLQQLHEVADFDDADVVSEFDSPAARALLAEVEVLVTCWGCPELDATALGHMPRLRAVVHAAGSVKHHLGEEFWSRGIPASSAADANALPVAEFTLGAILLANKRVFEVSAEYRASRERRDRTGELATAGNYRKQVGIVGASRIGRRVLELLAPYDLDVVLTDPFVSPEAAAELGARLLDLDELVATSDVVSLHAPALPETERMIDERRIGLMRAGATLVNTARGSLVDTDALTAAVVAGRLRTVLDVTDPDPLPADSPLWEHPHALLTPHIAGSQGTELIRMGQSAAEEVARAANGEPLRHQVHASELHRTA